MNAPTGFVSQTRRLAAGIELVDAASGQPVLMPIHLGLDEVAPARRPPISRLPSNRYALLYRADLAAAPQPLVLRVSATSDGRYSLPQPHRAFVPRRLALTLPTQAAAEAALPGARIVRPWLYPGAAYPLSNTATGLRAHVFRNPAGDAPRRAARWVRVVASIPAAQADLGLANIIARASGDDRGEFVLLLPPSATQPGTQPGMQVRITVFAPAEADPPDPDLPARDPLWDVPLETPASWAAGDDVLTGAALPPGYAAVASRVMTLRLGLLARGIADFEF
ncbi:hypothetical protein [Chitinolyticbacter meiyuanensis]|uniref:hypothetical protein n=1 Tax=Chitinolyticbacter meiyuanensis TaxID=682798 RepID=UPI0011E5CE74|nr:hypothetical protein [Chitinolyticbacter meiyuanensis]